MTRSATTITFTCDTGDFMLRARVADALMTVCDHGEWRRCFAPRTRLARLNDSVLMTAEAQKALQAELEQLETWLATEIAERIKTAREWGDLKENSEYHDAKNDQAHLETKILRIREQLLHAEVREVETQTEVVGFGSRVEVEDAGPGKERPYTLVSAPEADPGDGKVSIDSPIGKALVGARVGDTVKLETPRGVRELKILAIGG